MHLCLDDECLMSQSLTTLLDFSLLLTSMGQSISPRCCKDVSNLSFAFYIFPLPAGVSLADDLVGGRGKIGSQKRGRLIDLEGTLAESATPTIHTQFSHVYVKFYLYISRSMGMP